VVTRSIPSRQSFNLESTAVEKAFVLMIMPEDEVVADSKVRERGGKAEKEVVKDAACQSEEAVRCCQARRKKWS
jgi:hypothetical protein